MSDDQETMQNITAKIDARLGRQADGMQDMETPGASARGDDDGDDDSERGPLGRDYHLAGKYAQALAIGEPGLIDRAEFDRLVETYGDE
ncbi:MAG: modification methylase HgiDII [Rhodococcus sp. (in: high G+C Gram-positive bacteria)]